jgi:hypothetical protein
MESEKYHPPKLGKPTIWKVGHRYGYAAIDEFDDKGHLLDTVIAGLKSKDAEIIVDRHNHVVEKLKEVV